MASSLKAAGLGGNPGVGYQPLSSPGLEHGGDDDDNNGERRWKISFRMITILRLLLLALAIANIIIWITVGVPPSNHSPLYLVFILLFIVVGWNLYVIYPRSCPSFGLPPIAFQVGNAAWVVCQGAGDGHLRSPVTTAQKRKKCILAAMVDMALALTIIIMMAAGWGVLPSWYNQYGTMTALLPLNIVVGVLEIVVALVTFASCYWTLIFEFGAILRPIDAPDSHTRVQLAPDTDDRRTAAGTIPAV